VALNVFIIFIDARRQCESKAKNSLFPLKLFCVLSVAHSCANMTPVRSKLFERFFQQYMKRAFSLL